MIKMTPANVWTTDAPHFLRSLLGVLDGRELSPVIAQAAALLATVVGQNLDEDTDGVFTIARRVAKDRVISTVDPKTRHGHKTAARGFDGYKGHIVTDPDSEIITATVVTPGNTGDAAAASDLLAQDLPTPDVAGDDVDALLFEAGTEPDQTLESTVNNETESADTEASLTVYGDAAYVAGELLEQLEAAGADIMCKVQPPVAPGGRFAKDRFAIDLTVGTVRCPGRSR